MPSTCSGKMRLMAVRVSSMFRSIKPTRVLTNTSSGKMAKSK